MENQIKNREESSLNFPLKDIDKLILTDPPLSLSPSLLIRYCPSLPPY